VLRPRSRTATIPLVFGLEPSIDCPMKSAPAAPPEDLTGTLANMAPEQTGRMNRSIDSRSDLYALDITFYQMLTGALPFAAADTMEWVHCHLARRPVAPADRRKEIPAAVSAIHGPRN
jgi:serine/threonine protein kinase